MTLNGQNAEESRKILVRQIVFEGNKKTTDLRMLREMELHVGDSLKMNQINNKLQISKERLINTGLFTDVEANIFFDEENYNNIKVVIHVEEGLYVIPIPIIELAARNLNVWWNEHDRDIKFLNLGLNLKLKNLSGNGDELDLLGQWGFDRKFIINYTSPFFDKEKNWNFEFKSYLASNKEVSFFTEDGIPSFVRNDNKYLRHRFESTFSTIFRPHYNSYYKLIMGFYYHGIDDELFDSNPEYLSGNTIQRYSRLAIDYAIERRNNKYLATKGYYAHLLLARNGIVESDNFRSWEIQADAYYHKQINDNWSWNNGLVFRTFLPTTRKYPYYNLFRMGGEPEYVRGYEYYQVEGTALAVYKTSVMRKIIDADIDFGKLMPFLNYKKMDTKIYLSLNLDYGYVWDQYYKTSEFINREMIGGGLGLNILLYNQLALIIEASMNQKNEFGVFFHLNRTI
ncbi:BamA/TamA family outer membrane protein [Membranihabitans maritimus]|uniref:BamA/TamA family outer membrane protein n=1 Tax=Membranihabitans maritimus TaxID=2904244 RepID=UPI001F01F05F|nr:BamA/TamA family outer membrane protein [Membranihabitans maritimus]